VGINERDYMRRRGATTRKPTRRRGMQVPSWRTFQFSVWLVWRRLRTLFRR